MRRLMEARSVAVVGASERPDASSGFVMRNLIGCGYTGRILPVHSSAPAVFGLKAVPKLADLDAAPDVAVISIPAAAAAAAVAEAAAIGTSAVVVLASGFAETGAEGVARQQALAAVAGGMALCGPNCLGVYAVRD